MKKVYSILAILFLTIGLFSCEAESTLEETSALYENVQATDGDVVIIDVRDDEDGTDGDVVIIDVRDDEDAD